MNLRQRQLDKWEASEQKEWENFRKKALTG